MGPEVQVGQDKKAAVVVVVLAGNLSLFAWNVLSCELVLHSWVLFSPADGHRGRAALSQLALPLNIKVGADRLADGTQVVTAACE